MLGRMRPLICAWIVYIWGLWFVPKMKILSVSSCPLPHMRNCSLAWDRWYWRGSSGTSSLLAGIGSCWLACLCNIFLLMWCRADKLMAATSDIPPSSIPNITWAGSWVSVALLLIFALTFAISHFVSDGAWVWLLIRSRKFPAPSNFIFALHSPLRLFSQSHDVTSFARFF